MPVNKVEMSLDEIIKENKKKEQKEKVEGRGKRGQAPQKSGAIRRRSDGVAKKQGASPPKKKPTTQPQEQQRIMLPTGLPAQMQMIFSNQQQPQLTFANGNIFMSPNHMQFVNRNPGQQFIPIMPAVNVGMTSQAHVLPSTSTSVVNGPKKDGGTDSSKKDSPSKGSPASKTIPKPIAVSAMGTPAFITAPSGQITPANLIPMPTQFYRMPNGTLLTSMPMSQLMTNMMHAQQNRPATSTQVQIMPAYIQPTQTVPSVNLTATAPATASAVKMPTSTGGLPAKVTIVSSTPMPTASTVSSAGQTATIAGLSVPAAKKMVHIAPKGLNGLLAAYTSNFAQCVPSSGSPAGIFPTQIMQAAAGCSATSMTSVCPGQPALVMPGLNGQMSGAQVTPTAAPVNGVSKRKRKDGSSSGVVGAHSEPSSSSQSIAGSLPSLADDTSAPPPLLTAQTDHIEKTPGVEDEENEPPPVLARDETGAQTIERIFTKEAEMMHRQLNENKDGHTRQPIKHFIDGMLIEEDVVPFPIEHKALLEELKDVEKKIEKEEQSSKKSPKKSPPKKEKADPKKAQAGEKSETPKKSTKAQPRKPAAAKSTAREAKPQKKAKAAAAAEANENDSSRPSSTAGRKRGLKEVERLLTMDFGPGRTPFTTTSPERYEKEVVQNYRALHGHEEKKPSKRSRDSPASMVSSSSVGKRPSSASSSRTGRRSNDPASSPRKLAKRTSRASTDAADRNLQTTSKASAKQHQEGSADDITEEEIRQWGDDTCNSCKKMFRQLRMRMREKPQYCSKQCRKNYKRRYREKLARHEKRNSMRQHASASCSGTPSSSTGVEKRDSNGGGQRVSSGSSVELSSPFLGRHGASPSHQLVHGGSTEDLQALAKKPRPSLSPVFRSPPNPALDASRSPTSLKIKLLRSPTAEQSPPLMRVDGRGSSGAGESFEYDDSRMDFQASHGYPQTMDPGASPRHLHSRSSMSSPQRQGPPSAFGFSVPSSSVFQTQSASNRSTHTAAISSFSESPPTQQLPQFPPSRPSSTSQHGLPIPLLPHATPEQLGELQRLFSADITHWTPQDVATWASIITMSQEYGQKFEEQEIDGESLLLLESSQIQSVVQKLGPKVKIEKALQLLKSFYSNE